MSLALKDVQRSLDKILKFLLPHIELANVHGSEFISKDLWGLLHPTLQDELLLLSNTQLKELPLTAHRWSCSETESHASNSLKSRFVCNRALSEDGDPKKVDCVSERTTQLFDDLESEDIVSKVDCVVESLDASKGICQEESSGINLNLNSLEFFCTAARNSTIEGCGLQTSISDLMKDLGYSSTDPFIGAFMNTKKCHEVEIMTSVCAALSRHANCELVVDFGSGKGYLGNQLVLQHSISVLGIDARSLNTQSASRRNRILDKQWLGLERNSQLAKMDKKLTRKEKKSLKMIRLEKREALKTDCDVQEESKFDTDNTGACIDCYTEEKKAQFVPCTMFIDRNTNFLELTNSLFPKKFVGKLLESETKSTCSEIDQDLHKLNISQSDNGRNCVHTEGDIRVPLVVVDPLERDTSATSVKDENLPHKVSETLAPNLHVHSHFPDSLNEDLKVKDDRSEMSSKAADVRLCLTGLHTCGNLASTAADVFVTSPHFKALCSVGCCYHLLREREYDEEANCHSLSDEISAPTVGFPLSQLLRDRKTRLGAAARNLASQSVHRIAQTDELQGERFYPRALLEVLVRDVCSEDNVTWTGLRKLEQKCTSTHQYIQRACEILKISDKVTNEAISCYMTKYSEYQRRLAAFFQLKTVLAPCIEAVVVLDRVCFLLEQKAVNAVYLVKLFDPVTSPRCYGIVAVK